MIVTPRVSHCFSSLIWLSRNKSVQKSRFSRIVRNSREFSLLDLDHFALLKKSESFFFSLFTSRTSKTHSRWSLQCREKLAGSRSLLFVSPSLCELYTLPTGRNTIEASDTGAVVAIFESSLYFFIIYTFIFYLLLKSRHLSLKIPSRCHRGHIWKGATRNLCCGS